MRHRYWTKQEEAQLVELFLKSKKNLGECKRLVLSDPLLKKQKRDWNMCYKKLRHTGLLEEGVQHDTDKYPFAVLTAKDLGRLDDLLRTQGVEAVRAAFPQYTVKQLRNHAVQREIKLGSAPNAQTKECDEKSLIKARETGETSVADFLEQLPKNSELRVYWGVIRDLLKKKRIVRNTDFLPHGKELNIKAKKRVHKLNAIRGILAKFVEWNVLVTFRVEGHQGYFCNLPDFYEAEELLKLIPCEETSRILRPFAGGPKTLATLEQETGRAIGVHVLETILNHYVGKGVLEAVKQPKGAFKLTEGAKLTSTDPAGLLALDLFKAENLLDQEEDREAQKVDPKDTKALAEVVAKDLECKTIASRVVGVKGDCARIFAVGETRLGNQFTDFDLLLFAQEEMKKAKPDIVVASGFVQGDHRSYQVERLRALTNAALLHKIASQYKHADSILRDFEKVAGQVIYLQSDDDWNIAKSRTLIAMRELFGLRRTGMSALFPEEIARLSGRDYVDYLRKQWEYVQPYMWRIGRSLLNKNEVNEIVPNLNKSEFLLILMVLLFKKFGHEIPESFAKGVDVEALFGDKAGSKRCVTPDPILLKFVFGDDKENTKLVQFVHNAAYSDVTQYLDSLVIMEKSFRQLQVRGVETPNFVFDFQQERFFGTNVGGTFMFNLPGCQNTLLAASRRLKTFNTQIVGEKSHKQNTFRKETVSSGIADFQVFKDGRFKFRILNNATMRVLENSRTVPEVKERFALFQDIQTGSPQMRLEWAIKAHDLALYGPNPVQHVSYNGDLIHGFSIYMQFVSESRIKKLVSIKSQQAMFERCFLPFYPAPTVKFIGRVLGNHEWDNLMAKKEGGDPLAFLESGLTNKYNLFREGYKQAMLDSGKKEKEIVYPYPDVEIIPFSRGRTANSGNAEDGGTAHWPIYTKEIAGFRYAVQHKWQPFGGGGRTPVDSQIKWVTNMAKAAEGINIMLGGHYHSFWVSMLSDILLCQMPGLIDQSGLELGFGLTPLSLFCMVEFSNKEGITVEMYPMEYLVDYQCTDPFYRDKNELLVRPQPGTREFEYGFDSPLIKQWEDEVDSKHVEV